MAKMQFSDTLPNSRNLLMKSVVFFCVTAIYIYRKLQETQHWTTSGEDCNCPERNLNPRPPDH